MCSLASACHQMFVVHLLPTTTTISTITPLHTNFFTVNSLCALSIAWSATFPLLPPIFMLTWILVTFLNSTFPQCIHDHQRYDHDDVDDHHHHYYPPLYQSVASTVDGRLSSINRSIELAPNSECQFLVHFAAWLSHTNTAIPRTFFAYFLPPIFSRIISTETHTTATR